MVTSSLLNDLKAHAKLEFTHIFSAEEFGSYKPNPAVYLGAVKKLGLTPKDCAMVAAHLGVMDFVIVSAQKLLGSRASISRHCVFLEMALAQVLQGAVRLQGLAS